MRDDREIFGAPSHQRWRPGDVLYLDAGVSIDGYLSDLCRMFVAGSASNRQRAAYERVVAARDAALHAFRPGMTAGDLATVIITSLGVDPGDAAGRYGHGLGLAFEPPSLHPDDPTPLAPGTVFCLEPALCDAGTYYALEEGYLVTDTGLERLTPRAPRELIAV